MEEVKLDTESDSQRFHALDSIRAIAMLLGIVLHGAISFMNPPLPFWPIQDSKTSLFFAIPVFLIHAFRLQTFFMMAGFFAALLIEKRGLWSFFANRFSRVAVPLVVFSAILIPIIQAIYIASLTGVPREPIKFGKTGVVFDLSNMGTEVSAVFSPQHFYKNFHFFHLWFLWYLLWMYLIVMLFGWISLRSGIFRRLERQTAKVAGRVFESRFRSLLLSIPTILLLYPMKTWTPDAPSEVWPELEQIAYYLFFFGIGWLLFKRKEAIGKFFDGWVWHLTVASILVLPLVVMMQKGTNESGDLRT